MVERDTHSSQLNQPIEVVDYEPTLSLIMIVKNEAHNLPELLGPIQDKFDEIVVVDTGSTDGTPEVARQYGAKVYFFEWIDDFAAARNESIRRATGDWLFWLDGDDRLEPDQVDILRRYARRAPQRDVGYYCHLISLGSQWAGTQSLLQLRLFPKVPGLVFVGAIHEQLTDSLNRLNMRYEVCPATIIHVGYMDPEKLPGKYERNLRLMQQILEKDPEDLHTRVQLIMQLVGSGQTEEAVQEVNRLTPLGYKQLGEDAPMERLYRHLLLRVIVLYNAGRLEEARDTCLRILEEMPEIGAVHFFLALIYRSLNDEEKMYEHLLKAEHYGINLDVLPMAVLRVHFDMATMKGTYYAGRNRWLLAAREFRAALKINPHFFSLYADMGQCYARAGNYRRAVEAYRMGIQIHDQLVEEAQQKDPSRLEQGTASLGTFFELSPDARRDWLSRMYAGLVQTLLLANRPKAAQAVLAEALERFPDAEVFLFLQLEQMLQSRQLKGAERVARKLITLNPDSSARVEQVVNLYLRYGLDLPAVPLMWALWRRWPEKWDALLIASFSLIRAGERARADVLLNELIDYLARHGVDDARHWPRTWKPDHPVLEFFSRPEQYRALSSDSDASRRDREFDEKLLRICGAIRQNLLGFS